MSFNVEFYAISIDTVAYRRALLAALQDLNERAGAAWVDAAVNQTPIPTWSGASRATFQKLASELGTTVPIGPIRSRKNRIALGHANSTGSGVVTDKGRPYVGFIYATSLRYLAYNEYNIATAGRPPQPYSNNVRFTPYNFQSRAQAAWLAVAKTAKLPNPYRYIIKRKM
jgi:hypothetical protein